MLMEKPSPQPKPKLTDAEVRVLRSFLRTVVLRAVWSSEPDPQRRLAQSMYDVWAMMPQHEAEHLWNVERKVHIEGLRPDLAIMILLNRVHLHLFDPEARSVAA